MSTGHSPGLPRFEDAWVADAMRTGVITCPPGVSLRTVARMMATYRVHAIVVTQAGPGSPPWAVVSDTDLARAAGADAELLTAGEVASTDLVTVTPEETLEKAARLMGEQGVSHLLVTHAESNHPLGIISTLDLASVLAGGR